MYTVHIWHRHVAWLLQVQSPTSYRYTAWSSFEEGPDQTETQQEVFNKAGKHCFGTCESNQSAIYHLGSTVHTSPRNVFLFPPVELDPERQFQALSLKVGGTCRSILDSSLFSQNKGGLIPRILIHQKMLPGNETKSGGKREPGTEVRKDEPG